MTLNYTKLLNKIQEIGDYIHNFSGKSPDIGVSKQWLTEHDLNTERQLCEFIKSIDDNASFFAEEEHEKLVETTNSLWIIDPISSTFNFIHGLPHYSICVSHMVGEEIKFAAVYDPSMKELFHAEKGKGAYLNGKRIHVSDNKTDLSIIIGGHLTSMNHKRSLETIDLIDKFYKFGTIRSIGSLGVHYAYVACGRAECTLSLPKDIFPEMAGKLLVEEAGGKFTDFDGNNVSLNTKTIVASNNVIHEIILNELKK